MTGYGLTPGFTSGGSATGTVTGPYNRIEYWCQPKTVNSTDHVTGGWVNNWSSGEWYAGSYTWTKPSAMNSTYPLKVWVWGPGGNGGNNSSSGPGYGGGGGGMSYKEIAVASLNATETVTIGVPQFSTYNNRGGASSFGAHCSSTAGNDGGYNTNPDGNPNATGENTNPLSGNYGQGGIGIGGDINRRGGWGGEGNVTPGAGSGGGGGSAPAPDGQHDGWLGGSRYNYSGGGGASIFFPGTRAQHNYSAAGGSGTAGFGSGAMDGHGQRTGSGAGGAGLFGAGGRGGTTRWYSSNDSARPCASDPSSGQGGAIWDPNLLFFGGAGGGAGSAGRMSSAVMMTNGACGGPGAGGGGCNTYDTSNDTRGTIGGNGGVLGGAGGAGQYCQGGNGGCAGGGGASGWDGYVNMCRGQQVGGTGLVIIQYAVE